MHSIENQYLKIAINPLGAELKSLISKDTKLEYMWQGNPAFWAKTSPVLFPIVGGLKDNTYFHNNQKYTLPRHGFAREKQFELKKSSDSSLEFLLLSDSDTRLVYPFDFEFKIIYSLHNSSLTVKYEVKNIGNIDMCFSVGAHPAFNLPLASDLAYTDYHLYFSGDDVLHSFPLTANGLVKKEPFAISLKGHNLNLKKELFYKDALVFKDLKSTQITLQSAQSPHGLHMSFEGFPYYGIWAARDADFVCLEPWCGIADMEETSQQLSEKEGIIKLKSTDVFEKEWRVEVF